MLSPVFGPGVMIPGQFGPMSVKSSVASRESAPRAAAFRSSMMARTLIMSLTGTPSVMQQMMRIPASMASRTASAEKAGGTKIMVASAPVSSTASRTVLKIGRLFASFCPPLPGVTPPTILVP